MDPASVASVRDSFRRAQDGVRAARHDARAIVDGLTWVGDDAEALRWAGTAELGGQLLQLEVLLAALDHWTTGQIAEQRRASAGLQR